MSFTAFHPSTSRALWLGLMLCSGSVHAWNWADDPDSITTRPMFQESRAVCAQLRDLTPPAADKPDAKTAASLEGCDAESLYYGIGEPADPVRARQCAFVQIERGEGQTYSGSAFGGEAMLMTIYANGVGAGRDLQLATALACRVQGAPMELDGRVKHLQTLKAGGWQGRDFSFCDDITSGYAGGICAAHDGAIKTARRQARLRQIQKPWPARRRRAFEPLQAAWQDYVSASTDNEVDMSGTLRVAFVVQQEQHLDDQFVDMLATLEAGKVPAGDSTTYQAADQTLNRVYQRLMSGPAPAGTVTRAGIRTTERAWLGYRDAWLRFAARAYPNLDPDRLGAWLTRQRTDELTALSP